MRGIKATMLKIDFQCGPAKKARVCKSQGVSHQPRHCIVTALQERSLVVCWRALESAESMKEITSDLQKSDRRLAHNTNLPTSAVRAVCIDNCHAAGKEEVRTKKIFAAEVKLDPFHWQQRWDLILESTTSKEASRFWSAMRQSIFVVNEEEFNGARDLAQAKKRRGPTTKQMPAEARTTIPPPAALRKRAQKVLAHFFHLDSVSNAHF